MGKKKKDQKSALEAERKKVLDEAKLAEDEFRLLDAARFYKLASNLSKDIGDLELARELINKANELKNRESRIRNKVKIEKQRLKAAKNIGKLEIQINKALEIAEVAISENRWVDASKFYNLAAKYAQEMDENERSKAFKKKAIDLAQRGK
ncbi:MAG: hypothetical protein HWN67_02690 [Candidatus Helarchaeota archaeon]|nr:hypothetical protein [Candidatus Helarchaeota archaeon]